MEDKTNTTAWNIDKLFQPIFHFDFYGRLNYCHQCVSNVNILKLESTSYSNSSAHYEGSSDTHNVTILLCHKASTLRLIITFNT